MPTLLLSDDSATVQRLIAMAFSAIDIHVVAVADGEEAIARITELRPDIVLASIGTPRRSGYDVAAHVKSTPDLAATPVLLLAAAFEPVDQVRVAQVRCDGVLVKPFETRQLVSRVRALLGDQARAVPPGPALRPPAVVAPSPASPSGSGTETVDDYFERLDAAFASRAPLRPSPPSDDVGTVPTVDSVLRRGVSAPAEAATRQAAPAVTDALVDEVTRRVVERLGTAAVRDLVADVVADVAERLVREEIARIRSKD